MQFSIHSPYLIEIVTERHRMAQEQYVMQEREVQNLQKRNQQLQEQYTRLDIACSHASEELASANGQIDRLRNECSNLRAEKKIWEVGDCYGINITGLTRHHSERPISTAR